MRTGFLVISLFCIAFSGMIAAEMVSVRQVPMNLPWNLSLGQYSPVLEFDYSGLGLGNYTLKVWLFDRENWNCASSQLCERTFTINNSGGGNSSGTLRTVQNIDVYNYSNMDIVARLYSGANSEVAWDEQYVSGTSNRPPVLTAIPTQSCVVGEILDFQAAASDPEAGGLQYWASGLPDGAVLDGSGSFIWTPQTEGTYEVYISADDGVTYDSQKVTIIVGPRPEFSNVVIPLCGSTANVTGKVEGIENAQNYKVVSYIYISGGGWWTKPYTNQPKTAILSDHTFAVDITTGVNDELANIIYLGICQADAVIPILAGEASIPQDIPVLNYQKYYRNPSNCHRIIEFSGHQWYVKDSGTGLLGPGPCYFSDSAGNVFVDTGGDLHLRISNDGGRWNCAQIVCVDEMGYGTYTFEMTSDPSGLDKNVVLGLFTWADDALNGKEIDIEYSRWGDGENQNAQFVVQPWGAAGHLSRFEFPATNETSTHSFTWQDGSVSFQTHRGVPSQSTLVSEWTYLSQTPLPGQVQPRIILWLYNNLPPSDGQPQEAIVKSFSFDTGRIEIPLVAGWNWVSFNMLPADRSPASVLADYAGVNGDVIISGDGRNTTYYNGIWYGTLAEIKPGAMYKLKSANGTGFTVAGDYVDQNTPISLVSGWNWIGSCLRQSAAVSAAFASLELSNNDVVIGPDGKNATYWGGAWYGTLTQIEPGKGYMIKVAIAQTFSYGSD